MAVQLIVTGLLLGLVAGVAAGMFGIGGGLIVVPILVLGYGLDQKTATGTSLFAIMWPVGILGVIEFYKRGELKPVLGGMIAFGMLFGTYAGARLVAGLSQAGLQRIYAVFLLVVGTWIIIKPYFMPPSVKPAAAASAPTSVIPVPANDDETEKP
jgi:uncharacterized membrane protein YfcA